MRAPIFQELHRRRAELEEKTYEGALARLRLDRALPTTAEGLAKVRLEAHRQARRGSWAQDAALYAGHLLARLQNVDKAYRRIRSGKRTVPPATLSTPTPFKQFAPKRG